MPKDPDRPPRNRDLKHPPRTGETIEPTVPPERNQRDREGNLPVPDEGTEEGEQPTRRPDQR